MRGFQFVFDHDLLLTIVVVEGRNEIVSTGYAQNALRGIAGTHSVTRSRPSYDHRHPDGLNDCVADRPQECAG
jgi:hypothetical protein